MVEQNLITPKMRDIIQYRLNIEYLNEMYGEIDVKEILKELEKWLI